MARRQPIDVERSRRGAAAKPLVLIVKLAPERGFTLVQAALQGKRLGQFCPPKVASCSADGQQTLQAKLKSAHG